RRVADPELLPGADRCDSAVLGERLANDAAELVDGLRFDDAHPRPATPSISVRCATYGPGRSPHSRGVGNTFAGLKMRCGSKAHRTRFIVSRSSSPNISAMYAALSWPTPCSPVIDPP